MTLCNIAFIPSDEPAMRAADQILDETFLQVRAKLLEVSAALDRIDRAAGDGDPLSDAAKLRRNQIDQAIQICMSDGDDRAARLQQLFSRKFESGWRKQMQL